MHKQRAPFAFRSTSSTTSSFILVCAPHTVHTQSGIRRQPTQKVTGNCSDGDPVSQKASGGRSASTSAHTVTVRLLASAFFPRPLHNTQVSRFPNAHFNMHPAREQKRRATWCEKRGGNTVQYEFNLFSKYDQCTNSCSRKDHKPRERSNPEGKRSKGRLCWRPGCCSTTNKKRRSCGKRRFPFGQRSMTRIPAGQGRLITLSAGDEKRAVKMARVAKELRLEGRQVIQSNSRSARLGAHAHMGSGLGSVRFMYRDRHCAHTVCGVRHALPHGVSTISCLGAARNSSQIDDRTPLVHNAAVSPPISPT
ncbi:hypothetical protein CI102_12024 [Trichoderma harzianum]|nr:hypothetical protein CI102_12024 [Trichoderma harzianum]